MYCPVNAPLLRFAGCGSVSCCRLANVDNNFVSMSVSMSASAGTAFSSPARLCLCAFWFLLPFFPTCSCSRFLWPGSNAVGSFYLMGWSPSFWTIGNKILTGHMDEKKEKSPPGAWGGGAVLSCMRPVLAKGRVRPSKLFSCVFCFLPALTALLLLLYRRARAVMVFVSTAPVVDAAGSWLTRGSREIDCMVHRITVRVTRCAHSTPLLATLPHAAGRQARFLPRSRSWVSRSAPRSCPPPCRGDDLRRKLSCGCCSCPVSCPIYILQLRTMLPARSRNGAVVLAVEYSRERDFSNSVSWLSILRSLLSSNPAPRRHCRVSFRRRSAVSGYTHA